MLPSRLDCEQGLARFHPNHISPEHVPPNFRERAPSLDDLGPIALLAKSLKPAGDRAHEGFCIVNGGPTSAADGGMRL
jgi:hypothetical protein